MKRDLRFEAVYPVSPERVWQALTVPEEISQWLMENDFQPRLGGKFELRGDPRPGFDGKVLCEVIEIDQPNRLAYRWVSGTLNTIVRFELRPVEGIGTRLILEHRGFNAGGGMMTSLLLAWKRRLQEALPTVLGCSSASIVQSNLDIVNALLARYEEGAAKFSALMSSIPGELIAAVPSEKEWSVHQTALHIVDAEIVGAFRLRMIAAQPGSRLASFAGDVWGCELCYLQQPLEPALELFQALRRATAAMLRQLPLSSWSNRADHEEAGEVTLETFLLSHCEHAEMHMQEIEELAQKLIAAPPAPAI